MAIPVSAGSGSGDFKPCPAGVHQAICVDVVDMGMLDVTWQGVKKTQHKVRIVWQIEDEDAETGKRPIVQKRYTASLHEKAQLRKDLESWRGRPFTDDELHRFDLETLLGANAFLSVVHAPKDGKTYANVTAIMPLKRGMEKLAAKDYVRVVDRTDTKQSDANGHSDHEPPPLTDDDIPF